MCEVVGREMWEVVGREMQDWIQKELGVEMWVNMIKMHCMKSQIFNNTFFSKMSLSCLPIKEQTTEDQNTCFCEDAQPWGP